MPKPGQQKTMNTIFVIKRRCYLSLTKGFAKENDPFSSCLQLGLYSSEFQALEALLSFIELEIAYYNKQVMFNSFIEQLKKVGSFAELNGLLKETRFLIEKFLDEEFFNGFVTTTTIIGKKFEIGTIKDHSFYEYGVKEYYIDSVPTLKTLLSDVVNPHKAFESEEIIRT